MSKYGPFPGWRTMNAAQRRNARYDAIWDEYRRLEAAKRQSQAVAAATFLAAFHAPENAGKTLGQFLEERAAQAKE